MWLNSCHFLAFSCSDAQGIGSFAQNSNQNQVFQPENCENQWWWSKGLRIKGQVGPRGRNVKPRWKINKSDWALEKLNSTLSRLIVVFWLFAGLRTFHARKNNSGSWTRFRIDDLGNFSFFSEMVFVDAIFRHEEKQKNTLLSTIGPLCLRILLKMSCFLYNDWR